MWVSFETYNPELCNLEAELIKEKIELSLYIFLNDRECVEPNNAAWQSLANEQNGPAGQETAELNNLTLHRDNIAELSCL